MRFYRKDIGKRKKEFYKVYDNMPESIPEVFRKGTLITYDMCSISCNPLAPVHYKVFWAEHTMTGQKEIEAMFKYDFQVTEINEEEFENSMRIIKNLAKDIKGIYEQL